MSGVALPIDDGVCNVFVVLDIVLKSPNGGSRIVGAGRGASRRECFSLADLREIGRASVACEICDVSTIASGPTLICFDMLLFRFRD